MKAEIDNIKIQFTLEEIGQLKTELEGIISLVPMADLESIAPEFPKVNEFLKILRIEPGIPF